MPNIRTTYRSTAQQLCACAEKGAKLKREVTAFEGWLQYAPQAQTRRRRIESLKQLKLQRRKRQMASRTTHRVDVGPFPVHRVVFPLSRIHVAVGICHLASTGFLSVDIGALICCVQLWRGHGEGRCGVSASCSNVYTIVDLRSTCRAQGTTPAAAHCLSAALRCCLWVSCHDNKTSRGKTCSTFCNRKQMTF